MCLCLLHLWHMFSLTSWGSIGVPATATLAHTCALLLVGGLNYRIGLKASQSLNLISLCGPHVYCWWLQVVQRLVGPLLWLLAVIPSPQHGLHPCRLHLSRWSGTPWEPFQAVQFASSVCASLYPEPVCGMKHLWVARDGCIRW